MLALYVAKPMMVTNFTRKINMRNVNVMLTCEVRHAYPTAEITWNIMVNELYQVVEKNSIGNYILHNNQSLEVYHRYILEKHHVTFMCLATNKYGSAQSVFDIWEYNQFYKG